MAAAMNSFVRNNALVLCAAVLAVLLIGAAVMFAYAGGGGVARSSTVAAKASLDEYDWQELSAISQEISGCASENQATLLASSYALCGTQGEIPVDAYKEVELADGTLVRVQLVGIWHDERTDGGKAGLTFAFADTTGSHAMNHAFEDAEGDVADSTGGWSASDMRAWLNGDFYFELPVELRESIVSAQKRTASMVDTSDESDEAGHLSGAPAEWVSETSDKLWLFSAAELCGAVPEQESMGVDASMTRVYGAEGTQYRLFADANVQAFAPNAVLERGSTTWWLRTKMLEFGDGFWLVGTDGTPLNGFGEDARVVNDPEYAPDKAWGPDHARGVIAGFCV